ncbi:MAG TPA: MFS transporter [Thermoleophilaceae bacterium]
MNARRDLAILVGAVGVSAAGDLAALSALAVHLQQTTGSGLVVAALAAANWLPLALGAPAAGALVDRMDARRLLIVASTGQVLVALALATTPGTGGVLALTALLGVGGAVAVPAEFALVGVLVAQGAGSGRANGRVETARYVGYLVGPLAGTALTAAAGVGAALAADGASFAAVALGAALLHSRRPPAPSDAPRPRARDGIALLACDRVLRLTVVVLVGSLLAMSTSVSADVFFAQQSLGVGSIGLGLLLSAWMAGMVAGSLTLAPRVPAGLLALAALAATAVQGSGKLFGAAIALLPVTLALYALGGAGQGVKNVSARALIHERVAPEAHGRAFAAFAGLRNCAELAALGLGGLMVDLLGARTTLMVAGGGTVLTGLAGLLMLRRPALSRLAGVARESLRRGTPNEGFGA